MDFNIVWDIIQKMFMNASLLSLIIVAAVQVLKIILNKIGLVKLKKKHKQLYTFIYSFITFLFIGLGLYLDISFYLGLTFDFTNVEFIVKFASLSLSTVALTYLMYNGIYEGVGIKALINFIWNSLKGIAENNPTTKFARFINALSTEKIQAVIDVLPNNEEELNELIDETKKEIVEAVEDIKEEVRDNIRIF